MLFFMSAMSVVIFLLLGSSDGFSTEWVDDGKRAPVLANGLFSAIAFIIGAVTSTACGYLGMMIGTYANARTALEARRGLAPAFALAFRSGVVMVRGMLLLLPPPPRLVPRCLPEPRSKTHPSLPLSPQGFSLSSLGLLVLFITLFIFSAYYRADWEGLFEAITGCGRGGSSVALFRRGGGGLSTKAADVGADLVGKVRQKRKKGGGGGMVGWLLLSG